MRSSTNPRRPCEWLCYVANAARSESLDKGGLLGVSNFNGNNPAIRTTGITVWQDQKFVVQNF